jgi:NADPH-dependent 2,4-dienoyl-CoA reductase/sulfur reductase-like enzyme
MPHYHYLIVGGATTADHAVQGIRKVDPDGTIGLISAEPHPPYNRVPLDKGLWKGKPYEKIFFPTAPREAELHLGRSVAQLDPAARSVTDDQGQAYTYEKLLLATGGTPRRLPFGGEAIVYFRTLDDYHWLRQQVEKGGRFAVIGGGFIGSEVAALLAMREQPVSMLFPEAAIGSRLFPPDLAEHLNQYYRQRNVEVLAGELVGGAEARGDQLVLKTKSGKEVVADHVIAGLGIRPNTALAEAAGLEVGDGIIVDEHLRSSLPDIYAAGDVANFYNPALDRRQRVEHEDHAMSSGRVVGRNMAGDPVPYDHLPMFYSDLFDLGYEAVGDLDPSLETFADWQEPLQKGVIYYLKDGRVRGVILWDVWGQVEAARQLITERRAFTYADLKGRITG